MLFLLGLMAIALTAIMFHSRNAMLGFPAAIFWMLTGAYSYTLFTTPWVDIEFYLAIASMLGMVPFTILGAYGLKEKKDTGTDEEEYLDEQPDQDKYMDETKEQQPAPEPDNARTRLRKRSEARRARLSGSKDFQKW